MRAIGVLWGYGSREELERAGADAIVATPQALVRAVESSRAA
jgi:phosphoglycolate phosphatase